MRRRRAEKRAPRGPAWLGLAAALGATSAAADASSPSAGALWTEACVRAESAAELPSRVAAARECARAAEDSAGFTDPRLIDLYDRLGRGIAGARGTKAAIAALPYRRRAYRSADRLLGPEAGRTGQAALDHARGWILTGRCEGHDPRVLRLLEAARRGYAGAAAGRRFTAYRAIAAAYADVLAYELAEETMLDAGAGATVGGDAAPALGALEWERLGVWRLRRGALGPAAEAYRAALAATPAAEPRDAHRMRQALRRILFEQGDLDSLRALEAAGGGSAQ